VTDVDLEGFASLQNVVSGLFIKADGTNVNVEVELMSFVGLFGTITAKKVSIEFIPGLPEDAQTGAEREIWDGRSVCL
jgi:hypothetical protein